MRYSNEIIKMVVNSVISGTCSVRVIAKDLGIARSTVTRWVNRTRHGIPTRFKRTAKRVWNRTFSSVLNDLRQLLKQGKSVVQSWIEIGKKISMRTIQRWKALWFPEIKEKKQCKRYVRKKVFSLMHTDWGVKRILNGKRICFTFYEDDATRRLYSLRAYSNASLDNTLNNLRIAKKKTNGFKAVLSDCGAVYRKSFGEECKVLDIKSAHTRPYNPKCNGKAEAVVKKVKAFLNKHIVRDLDHANMLLTQYQKEYNNTPHSSLKYSTPLQVFRAKQRAGLICAVG